MIRSLAQGDIPVIVSKSWPRPSQAILAGRFVRYQSSSPKATQEIKDPVYPINHDSIYVVSIPITNYKSYIYCNHKPSILSKAQLQRISWITKLESKFTGLASKGWNKLSTSDKTVNVKITNIINKLLNTISYEENCLKSFPSQKAMIREINEELLDAIKSKLDTDSSVMVQSEIDTLSIPVDQLKPIPIYHPSFQNPTTILNQLNRFRDEGHAMHMKYATLCAIGVPLSLPFALVPVLPNVPGLYLSYRLYCNIKALLGVKHLDYLLESSSKEGLSKEVSSKDTSKVNDKSNVTTEHLTFKAIPAIDTFYHPSEATQTETIIITNDIIDSLCKELGFAHLKDDLHKALHQETERLKSIDSK